MSIINTKYVWPTSRLLSDQAAGHHSLARLMYKISNHMLTCLNTQQTLLINHCTFPDEFRQGFLIPLPAALLSTVTNRSSWNTSLAYRSKNSSNHHYLLLNGSSLPKIPYRKHVSQNSNLLRCCEKDFVIKKVYYNWHTIPISKNLKNSYRN